MRWSLSVKEMLSLDGLGFSFRETRQRRETLSSRHPVRIGRLVLLNTLTLFFK